MHLEIPTFLLVITYILVEKVQNVIYIGRKGRSDTTYAQRSDNLYF